MSAPSGEARGGVLVTGASGFVGARLVARLARRGVGPLHALTRGPLPEVLAPWPVLGHRVDLLERPALLRLLAEIAPAQIFHLAALAHPQACRRDPARALAVNAGGTANLLAGLVPGRARVLLASSAQVYGRRGGLLSEALPLRPTTTYGRSKRAAEAVARRFTGRGLAVVVARSFNHTGRGQSADYVLPALTEQLRRALATGAPLRHGNLFPRRDFLHVEDVLDAYELLLERGDPSRPYNVASGRANSIGEWLEGLMRRLGRPQSTALDPDRVRSDDPAEIVGDPHALQSLGWSCRWDTEAILDELAGIPPRL